jgi:hypothetical protein
MPLRAMIRKLARSMGWDIVRYRRMPVDLQPEDAALVDFVRPYTLTTPERIYALAQACRYIVAAGIDGTVVECGVWRGGSCMAVARTLLESQAGDREIYLFDTFSGMPKPSDLDVDEEGRPAILQFQRSQTGEDSSSWDAASLNDVKTNLAKTGYDRSRLHYIQGKVEETLPGQAPARIALLRLDTDWYESTRHELETLWPRIASGGVLIIDDYGFWKGSRKAVDEYFAEQKLTVLLCRIDSTGRMAIKCT